MAHFGRGETGTNPHCDADFGFHKSSNRFDFDISGSTLQTVIIQAGADLNSWTPVKTNPDDRAAALIQETAGKNIRSRYYRLLLSQ